MEETGNNGQESPRVRFEDDGAQLSDDLADALHFLDEQTEQEHRIVPFRPLLNFIKFHTQYINLAATSANYVCPICRDSPAESHEHLIQINLPNCHHVFGEDCLERYIQRSHTCPMCREMWFTKRLSPEVQEGDGGLNIRITVATEEDADSLQTALEDNGSSLVRQLLGGHITELSDSDDDTYTEGSTTEDDLDTQDRPPRNYSPLDANEIFVEVTGLNASSQRSSETGSEVSRVSRQEINASLEISDEDTALGAVDWSGNSRRSASDDEALAPPRQRRRYG
ncbi:hypothetical protein BU23DRAFT_568638 [Bimuria novae-zelandiae CBS 107.79]|uniref:RING-type domain-containing protein n=1 Tax=Bimuria novae-zelandiae CBS 107.79 TaxID=1447943 RepID=A0A6A5VDK2_9PLEO|nr:hypothetical protein BU23DRAFT_568638 [Bimuria novae-zelandiae CBS 107.79]